jgi:hypothetical protein
VPITNNQANKEEAKNQIAVFVAELVDTDLTIKPSLMPSFE